LNLLKSYIGKLSHIPHGVDLTYAIGHVIFRKEPWVVDVEAASILAGQSDSRYFGRYRGKVRDGLYSDFCKKVICWTHYAKATVEGFISPQFAWKIAEVPPAVPKRQFVKNFRDDIVRILFVGSANISGNFELKGGNVVLEAFSILAKNYDNIQLIIRSDLPKEMRSRCRKNHGIVVLDGTVSAAALDEVFRSADIFVFPSHNSPLTVLLDAMSFELPIVASNVDANPEFVLEGRTGLLVEESERISRAKGRSDFWKEIKKVDRFVVESVADKVSVLIENSTLRRGMGREGRAEIESGKFSIEKMNLALKHVFDEATSL
jgi:glycosyltransferase involved in cell wall biosynthesis